MFFCSETAEKVDQVIVILLIEHLIFIIWKLKEYYLIGRT